MTRATRWLFDQGGLLELAMLVLYVALSPTHIVDGDNAHFAALGAVGGVGHPSGYPLYILWLRAWSWLPGASPAHVTAIATAILAAFQVVALHAACRAWGARPLAATLAVGVFAVAPVVIRIHTEAEVFAMNGLAVAAVMWIAAAHGPLRGAARGGALGLVAGLGLANHFTCALIAPVGLLGVVRGMRETGGSRAAVPALAIGGLVVGLTPYLYFLIAPSGGPSWGNIDSLQALLDLALRKDYGGPLAFAATGTEVTPLGNLMGLVGTLGRTWLWGLGALGLVTLGARCVRSRGDGDGEPVWGWRLLALAWLVAGPILVLRFNLAPSGLGLYVVARFHILPALLLVVPVACGLDWIGAQIRARASGSLVRSRGAMTALALVAIAAVASLSLGHLQRVHTPAVEMEIENALGTLPPGAVVIGSTDDLLFGFAYVQSALGERPDVIYINWPMMGLPWYRDHLRRAGLPLDIPHDSSPSTAVAKQVFAQGHRLFVDRGEQAMIAGFPHFPYGTLIEIVPRGTPAPTIDHLVELNRQLYGKFQLGYPLPGFDDEWATEVHNHYAATWVLLGNALKAAGRPDDANQAYAYAHQVGPQEE